ncbi:MAG: UDP-N-acetylglucosamine--N-acetylmuramyl-(pentapeptide) pyrophosphoryl-undecaprenol N-acetylglucosamine transferase [Atribacterota bacterium]
MKPCVFIAGGGTGGHVIPSLCIALEIRKRVDWDIIFLGTKRGMERELVRSSDFRMVYLVARGWNRHFDWRFLRLLVENLVGFLLGGWYFLRYRPRAFLAMGSYLSLLGGIWARWFRIPIYVHEQNIYPGLANRIVARWAKMVFVAAQDAIPYFEGCKTVKVVGNPLREEVMEWRGKKEEARKRLMLEPGRRTILVMGGSRGSEVINENFLQALDFLDESAIQVVHITGKEDFFRVEERARRFSFPYRVYPFLSCPGMVYAVSDLAICRAGANTVFELFFFGVPSILVPYAEATESHQVYNALWLQRHQPVEIIEEHVLCPDLLGEKIRTMFLTAHRYSEDTQYLKRAASIIAEEIVGDAQRERRKKIGRTGTC